jgi:hypothetical protein
MIKLPEAFKESELLNLNQEDTIQKVIIYQYVAK